MATVSIPARGNTVRPARVAGPARAVLIGGGSRTRIAVALVVLGWLVVFVGGGIGSVGAGRAPAEGGTILSAGRTHRVERGETLWSIATRLGRGGDPRGTVAEIASLNHLSGAELRVGQELVLP